MCVCVEVITPTTGPPPDHERTGHLTRAVVSLPFPPPLPYLFILSLFFFFFTHEDIVLHLREDLVSLLAVRHYLKSSYYFFFGGRGERKMVDSKFRNVTKYSHLKKALVKINVDPILPYLFLKKIFSIIKFLFNKKKKPHGKNKIK